MRIDEALYAALREPRRNRMTHWERAFEEHRDHREFQIQGWAFSREVGFSCGCSGCDTEYRISLTTLRNMVPQAQDAYTRLLQGNQLRRQPSPGTKIRRREGRRANARARALLHQGLTRVQRWELRATKAFTMQGNDGKTYLITEGSTSNVKLLVDGVPTHSLCVIARGLTLPVYDLMLAQKLLLENNPEEFWKIAVVKDLRPEAQVSPVQVGRIQYTPLAIADEDLEDPTAWVEQHLGAVG